MNFIEGQDFRFESKQENARVAMIHIFCMTIFCVRGDKRGSNTSFSVITWAYDDRNLPDAFPSMSVEKK